VVLVGLQEALDNARFSETSCTSRLRACEYARPATVSHPAAWGYAGTAVYTFIDEGVADGQAADIADERTLKHSGIAVADIISGGQP
jgi:hypothetical protein